MREALVKVHPEPRFFTPPLKTGLRAAERLKIQQGICLFI
jgi:hypothetical protein